MPSQRTDASVAFSVTDNLSQSIVGMKNSVNSFKQDVTGLQQQLDKLDSTRFQLKNFDLKNARQELDRTKKALQELGDTATEADREAARADFERANQNYENVRRQLNLVSKQARQTERDLLDATDAISKADNRAGSSVGGVLSALGKAGLMDMAGDVALDFGNLVVGSTFGSEVGGVVSSGISGALSGAAMGSLLGPVGTAVGAAIGGGLGLLQAAQGRDDAFKQYYSDLYDTQQAAAEESLSAGGDTASQRELDAIAFNRLLGQGVGDQYLEDLRTLAADTPMEYGDLTSMSRAGHRLWGRSGPNAGADDRHWRRRQRCGRHRQRHGDHGTGHVPHEQQREGHPGVLEHLPGPGCGCDRHAGRRHGQDPGGDL
jgi:flagellar biosynthesis chaperone FliJ